MNRSLLRLLCGVLLILAVAGEAAAQRSLYWDTLDVTAHLDDSGDLHVTETQTMVFTGAWNGGERRFNIRPGQELHFESISRNTSGGWRALTGDPDLDDLDDYALAGTRLRWRSRMPTDPVFAGTPIRYQLRYTLSGVVLKKDDGYGLDHDFAFADRDGPIIRFTLRLTLDPAWQSSGELRREYVAGPLAPGRTFVLHLPLRYEGTGAPAVLDLSRPPEIRMAVAALLGFTVLAVGWFFVREQSYGRFTPLADQEIDGDWLREHLLQYPAEVVGAAWDQEIGPPEVVALLARMTRDGTLESEVGDDGSMTLRLKVDRSSLEGHERSLVDALFFDGRTETSTDLVKDHYRSSGFNPSSIIRKELDEAVQRLLPPGDQPRSFRIETLLLFLCGLGLLVLAWSAEGFLPAAAFGSLGMLAAACAGWIVGMVFRGRIEWGRRAALACLTPAFAIGGGLAWYIWSVEGPGFRSSAQLTLLAVVLIAIALIASSVNALKSRQHRRAIALRKRLASARAFFASELDKDQPVLRDEWYPWVVAFGLGPQMDAWTIRRPRPDPPDRDRPVDRESPTPDVQYSHPAPAPWGGFGGGRSGGAGASGTWTAAAGGMAAAIPAVSRSSGSSSRESDGGSSSWDSSSSSSSDSSSGSSGGGGGGGW